MVKFLEIISEREFRMVVAMSIGAHGRTTEGPHEVFFFAVDVYNSGRRRHLPSVEN